MPLGSAFFCTENSSYIMKACVEHVIMSKGRRTIVEENLDSCWTQAGEETGVKEELVGYQDRNKAQAFSELLTSTALEDVGQGGVLGKSLQPSFPACSP